MGAGRQDTDEATAAIEESLAAIDDDDAADECGREQHGDSECQNTNINECHVEFPFVLKIESYRNPTSARRECLPKKASQGRAEAVHACMNGGHDRTVERIRTVGFTIRRCLLARNGALRWRAAAFSIAIF
jgi:hypothetical protein